MCQEPNRFEIPSEEEEEYFEEDSSEIESLIKEEDELRGETPSSDNRRRGRQSCQQQD